MADAKREDLENPEEWAFERAQRRSNTRRPRAVVSVAFSRDDFERIGEAAESLNMKVSEYIRTAALELAALQYTHLGAGQAVSQGRWSYLPSGRGPEVTTSEGRHLLERTSA